MTQPQFREGIPVRLVVSDNTAWESSLPREDKILGAHCRVSSRIMYTKHNVSSVKHNLPTEEKLLVSFTFNTQNSSDH